MGVYQSSKRLTHSEHILCAGDSSGKLEHRKPGQDAPGAVSNVPAEALSNVFVKCHLVPNTAGP